MVPPAPPCRRKCRPRRKRRKKSNQRRLRPPSPLFSRTRFITTGLSPKTNTAPPTVRTGRSRPPDRRGSATNPPPTPGITKSRSTHASNPNQIDTTYHFEYGETTSYGTETPPGGQSVGSGSSPVAVSATLTGLHVGETYHFRAVAENAAGTTTGADQTFTTVPSAPADATYATGVGASEATLHTQINPLGNDTRYYFQYGTQSCQDNPAACTNVPAPPGEDIGSGTEDVAGEAKLTGLQPRQNLLLPRPRLKLARRNAGPRTHLHNPTGGWLLRAPRQPRLRDGLTAGQGRSAGGSSYTRRRADPRRGRWRCSHLRGRRRAGRRSAGQPQPRMAAGHRDPWSQRLAVTGHSHARAAKRRARPPAKRRSTSFSPPICRSHWWNPRANTRNPRWRPVSPKPRCIYAITPMEHICRW